MAFPYIFADNFETGSNSGWDSESDTGSLLDFPHYSTLSNIPNMSVPYSGAYCMRVKAGDTNDHTLTEASIAAVLGTTIYSSFMLYIGKDFTATADDTFNIYELQGAAAAVQSAIALRITASTDEVDMSVGKTGASSSYTSVSKGVWHHIEIKSVIADAAGGSVSLYMDGIDTGATSVLITNIDVTQGVFGTQDTLATTTGTLLFDDFRVDDALVYPHRQRFPNVPRITKSGHVFVGPGWIEGATLLSANGTMDVYDTDVGNITDLQSKLVELSTSGNFVSYDQPVYFERGCYVVLGGTNPYGEVKLVTNSQRRGIFGPTAWGGDGAIRNYGQKRVPRPGNV